MPATSRTSSWRLATDPRVLDVMEHVVGPDVMLLGTHFFNKQPDPDADSYVAWHQDVTYWGLEPSTAGCRPARRCRAP